MTTSPPLPAAGTLTVTYSLPDGAELASRDGRLVVRTVAGTAALGSADAALSDALLRFVRGLPRAAAEDLLLSDPSAVAATARLARFSRLADALQPLLRRHFAADGGELFQAVPMTRQAPAAPATLPDGARVRLSRAAFLRAAEGRMLVESPFATCAVTLTDPRVAALAAALSDAAPLARHTARQKLLPEPLAREVIGWLAAYGLVAVAGQPGADGGPAEFAEDTGVLGQWSATDLLMHSRSRMGWSNAPYGATFRLLGKVAPEPAVRRPHTGRTVDLHRPATLAVCPDEPSFSEILEARQSIRSYGQVPLSLRQLGEFLFRAARTRARYGPYPQRAMPYEAADRPSPSGGGTHDLEVYVTAHRVEGLARSVYHYDPWRHVLVEVCDRPDTVEAMLATGTLSKGGQTPDALLTFTARFSRLAWKYERIAYATTLRNVGALYQTCYLVATAMGLAPCALGGGDSALAAQAIGADPYEEGSVGDFALGSLPAGAHLDAERNRVLAGAPDWQGGQAPEWCQVRRTVITGPRTPR
jgi:SagB-type dehydrogenase family enzyme